MEGRLLVDSGNVSRLALGSGEEVTLDVELETCDFENKTPFVNH